MQRKWIYVDVNILYYFFTAHPQFGECSRELLRKYFGRLVTSSLSAWLLYVLIRDEKVIPALEEVATLLELNSEVLRRALSLKRPKDFEDRIHLATMQIYGIDTILSNDDDFENVGVTRIAPRRS